MLKNGGYGKGIILIVILRVLGNSAVELSDSPNDVIGHQLCYLIHVMLVLVQPDKVLHVVKTSHHDSVNG